MGNINNNFPGANGGTVDKGVPSPGKIVGSGALNSGRVNRGLIPDASSAAGRAADDPMLITSTLGPDGSRISNIREIRNVPVPDDSNKSGVSQYNRSQDEARMLSAVPHGPGADFPSPGPVYGGGKGGQLGKE